MTHKIFLVRLFCTPSVLRPEATTPSPLTCSYATVQTINARQSPAGMQPAYRFATRCFTVLYTTIITTTTTEHTVKNIRIFLWRVFHILAQPFVTINRRIPQNIRRCAFFFLYTVHRSTRTHDDVGAEAGEEFDSVVKATDLRKQRMVARQRGLAQSLGRSNRHQVGRSTTPGTLYVHTHQALLFSFRATLC